MKLRIAPDLDRLRASSSAGELAVDPKSIDETKREFDVVWSTGARAPMVGFIEELNDWLAYDEELEMTDGAWDLTRVRNGNCPLLDAHGHGRAAAGGPDSDDVLGVVLKVWFAGNKGHARCRFSDRPELEGKWSDVKRGILRGVSPRYIPQRYVEITANGDKKRTFRPRRSELREISLVPITADAGARVRSASEGIEVELEHEQERDMADTTNSANNDDGKNNNGGGTPAGDEKTRSGANGGGTAVEDPPAKPVPPAAPAKQAAQPPVAVDESKIRAAERARIEQIRAAATTLGIPHDDEIVKAGIDGNMDFERARGELVMRRAALDRANLTASAIHVGQDGYEKLRAAMQNALFVQARVLDDADRVEDRKPVALTTPGRDFIRMSPMRMAERWLEAVGVDPRQLNRKQIAGAVLGLEREIMRHAAGGMATSNDFPLLLANTAGKVLRDNYAAAPSSWRKLAGKRTAPDFKQMTTLQFGEDAQLEKVNEHGERKRGKLLESREQYRIETFAKDFAFTRQLMINDDLGALMRMPQLLARMVSEFEANLVWTLILSNPTMADGNAVFSAAHGNINAPLALDQTGLETIVTKLGRQTMLDGRTPMNLRPTYLVVPLTMKIKAIKETSAVNPNITTSVNPFVGMFEEIIAEPRIDGTTLVDWWVVAGPSQVDGLQYAHLEGNEGPFMDQYTDPRTEGVVMSVREDFGAAFIDYRGWQFANN